MILVEIQELKEEFYSPADISAHSFEIQMKSRMLFSVDPKSMAEIKNSEYSEYTHY